MLTKISPHLAWASHLQRGRQPTREAAATSFVFPRDVPYLDRTRLISSTNKSLITAQKRRGIQRCLLGVEVMGEDGEETTSDTVTPWPRVLPLSVTGATSWGDLQSPLVAGPYRRPARPSGAQTRWQYFFGKCFYSLSIKWCFIDSTH